jgi:hypothetical protein
MKKIIIVFIFALFAFKSQATMTYNLVYDAINDKFVVSFTSTVTYDAAHSNIGASGASVVFSSGYNLASMVVTSIAAGAWGVQGTATSIYTPIIGYKVANIATSGGNIATGITAGTSYNLFSFTFGLGNNCGGTLRLFVNATDPADPDNSGSDYTSYVEQTPPLNDWLSTNSNSTFQTCASLTVPVKYSNFSAAKNGNDAQLNWTVQNQDANSDHFAIERSFNGVDFAAIGTMPVNLSNSTGNYNYKDLGIIPIRRSGLIFYRIKEVDKDGRSIYTEVRAVRVTASIAVSAYPNPATSYVNLTIDLDKAATVNITINDATGKEVQNFNLEGNVGFNITRLHLEKFSSGNYIINVKIGDSVQVVPIIKQ